MKTILLLGGYGAAGYETARILLARMDVHVVIAGRDAEKARAAADRLVRETDRTCVSSQALDAANYQDLVDAFRRADWIVVCIPLTGLGSRVAQAAFEAGVHYIDINGNDEKRAWLQAKAGQIEAEGLHFVTEAGFAPGVPSLLVRHVWETLGNLASADVGGLFRDATITYGSAYDLLVELGAEQRIFERGVWRQTSMSDAKEIDFGHPHGRQRCYPFELCELVDLPLSTMGIDELGLYAAGFNPLVDMVVVLWKLTRLNESGFGLRLGARIAAWGGRFTKPPYCTAVQVDAASRDGRRMRIRLSHENGYVATAIPLVACMLQVLEAGLPAPRGLHLMGHLLEPGTFLEDIERMGMEVELEVTGNAQPSAPARAQPSNEARIVCANPRRR